MQARKALNAAVAVAMLGLVGCSGPRQSIEVSVKEFPGDVALGKKPKPTPSTTAPSAVNPVPVVFPPFLQPPPPPVVFANTGAPIVAPSTTVPTTKPKPVCRTADPLASPKVEAPKNVSVPPAAQQVAFHNSGTYQYTDRSGPAQSGAYPTDSTRLVASKSNGDGTFRYDVLETAAGIRTTTTYYLDPANGLYLWAIQTTGPGGTDQFVAERPNLLLLLPFPVTQTAPIGGAAIDVQQASSMSIVGTVVGKARVDACGTPLDTWEVQITNGRLSGPGEQVNFTATYDIGTQYGALSVREQVEYHCDDQVNAYCYNGKKIVTNDTSIASVEPKPGATP